MTSQPTTAAALKQQAPFGLRYQYLAGGVNTGSGWATWNQNGTFVSRYVDDISQNIDATARNMSEFSRSIRANPGVLLSGTDAPDPPQGAPK